MKSRRQFFKLAGTGMLAAGASSVYGSPRFSSPPWTSKDIFSLGMAGYTFKGFSIEQTIEMMNYVGITYLSLKDFHMPMNSTREQINSVIQKFRSAGITVYAVGVVYMTSEGAVDQAFEYAKMAGVNLIVGAPDYNLLPYVEKKIKKYNIRLAIHNHGPDNPLYPNATDIWDHIKNMDPGLGICIDIGHTVRDGQDPSVDVERYSSRIFDIHTKDVDKASKDGKTVEIGRGIIDFPKFIATLRKIKYSGKCSLEFEKVMKDPLPGISESMGYLQRRDGLLVYIAYNYNKDRRSRPASPVLIIRIFFGQVSVYLIASSISSAYPGAYCQVYDRTSRYILHQPVLNQGFQNHPGSSREHSQYLTFGKNIDNITKPCKEYFMGSISPATAFSAMHSNTFTNQFDPWFVKLLKLSVFRMFCHP